MRKLWDARVAEAKATVLGSGVKVNEVDPEPFRSRMRPVWESFVKTAEQRDLVAEIRAMGGGNA
jgi:TRAP-type C4-dicarboxylate transport system substrate-binding protein